MSEPSHPPGSFRELFAVSLPLIISAGSHSLMHLADRIMLAGYQPTESTPGAGTSLDIIAAVTPAGMLHWTAVCIPLGTILYANTFISQFDGANKPRELAASFWQCVWLAIVAVLLSVIGAFYYLRIVKLMYFDEPVINEPILPQGDVKVLFSVNGLAVILLGIFPQMLMGLSLYAIQNSM